MSDFEVIFQITIKYLKKSDNADPIEYALSSLGLDDTAIKVYKALSEVNISTPEELGQKLGLDIETIIEKLDNMYSLGLIDKLGRAYIKDMDLPAAIRSRVKKRIEHLLNFIAKVAEGVSDER